MATRVVGFDIGTRHVRAVVLETSLRGFQLVELLEERIIAPNDDVRLADVPEEPNEANESESAEIQPEPPQPILAPGVAEAIRRILSRPNFEYDFLSANLPEGAFLITAIDLPFSGDKEVRAVLAPQLDGKLSADVDELHLDYMRSGKTPEGAWRIYAGGIPHEKMSELIASWDEIGASPRVLDVQPFSLFTATEWLLGPAEGSARAVIDLGAQFTRVLVTRGGVVELARIIPGGADEITARIAEGLKLDDDQARELKHRNARLIQDGEEVEAEVAQLDSFCREALRPMVRDLRRTLSAHASTSEGPISEVVLTGGGSYLKGIEGWLEQSLGAPVRVLPFRKEELASVSTIQTIGNRFTSALGAALRGTNVVPASTFNLRRGPWAFRGAYEYITSKLPMLAALAAMLLFSFVFFMMGRNALMKAEFQAAEKGLSELSRQVLGASITDPSLVRARLARGVDGPGLHPEVSAYDMIVRISQAAQSTVDNQMPMEITSLDVDMSRRQAKVSGTCETANTAETFGRNLGMDDCLQNVQRSSLTQRSSDSKFEFSFTATVNCKPAAATSASNTEEAPE